MSTTEKSKPSLFNEDPHVNIEHEDYFDEINPYPADTIDHLEDRSDDETLEDIDPYPKETVDPFEEEDPKDIISKLEIAPRNKFDYFEDEYEFYEHKDNSLFDKFLEHCVPSFQFSILVFTFILIYIFTIEEKKNF